MSDDIYDYIYVSQGKTKVDSIDDNEELEYTEDAFNVLGFEEWEKFDCYMLTAGDYIDSFCLLSFYSQCSLHLKSQYFWILHSFIAFLLEMKKKKPSRYLLFGCILLSRCHELWRH